MPNRIETDTFNLPANVINALAAQQVVTNGLITSRFKLADGVKALEAAKQSNQIKVVLQVK